MVAGLHWLPFPPLVTPNSPASPLAFPPTSHMHATPFLERGPRFPSSYRSARLYYPKQIVLLLSMPWLPERKGGRTSAKGVRQKLQPSLAFTCPCGELSCKGGWKHAQHEVLLLIRGNYCGGCCTGSSAQMESPSPLPGHQSEGALQHTYHVLPCWMPTVQNEMVPAAVHRLRRD